MTRKGIKYITLTFVFTWINWYLLWVLSWYNVTKFGQPLYWTFFILGGSGPFIAAFVVNLQGDKQEYKEFIKQFIKIKVSPLWYLFILIIPILYFSVPWVINALFKGTTIKFFRDPIYMVFVVFPLNIVCGGSEEVGWRGILLPELLVRFSKIKATLTLGTIWGIWHLPLFFIKGSPQENSNFIFFFIITISLSFLLTVLYTGTNSILLCILFHAFINSYPSVLNIPIFNIYRESLAMLAFSILIFFISEKINSDKSIANTHNSL